jgi:hypothetical protein
MPAPRVFISSTCYDLRYIRENLKFLIRTIGYEPVLSEEGSVYYDPGLHAQDACLAEVPDCQMFLLIIGGRYGGRYRGSEKSITNAEYQAAVTAKVPIFVLVEKTVHDQYPVYNSNKQNPSIDAKKISYPAVDSVKIFDFMDEVQQQAVNNALVPFSDFEEMQSYLKQQWASMMYRFLMSAGEASRVGGILTALASSSERIEFITRQLIGSIGGSTAKLTVEFYDFLFEYDVIRDLAAWQLHPSPEKVLRHPTFDDFCGGLTNIRPTEDQGSTFTYGGLPFNLSRARLDADRGEYAQVRKELLQRLASKKIPVDQFLKG